MPPVDKRKRNCNYSFLDEKGLVRKRMNGKAVYVEKGDVIIGKVLTKSNKNGEEELIDNSYVIKSGEEGYIDRVLETVTPNGYKLIKVTIRNQKIPEIGDKLASRSAQKGTIGLLVPQENMPFSKDGITPDILINSHCLSGDTNVFTSGGLSKRIDEFSFDGFEKVLTQSEDNFLSNSFSLGMESKGIKKVLKLKLIDGREIICTPDHKIKVFDDGKYIWKESQYIEYDDKIVMGPQGTLDYKCEKEKDWYLILKNYEFNMKNDSNRQKSLALARILGYLYTDGNITKTEKTECCQIQMGCLFDVNSITDDIEILTNKRPTFTENCNGQYGYSLNIRLPSSLTKMILEIEGIVIGRKTTQKYTFPTFLFDDNCPISIIREFLASCFGGDGWQPYINGNVFSEIYFSKSVLLENQEFMIKEYEKIVKLINIFDADAHISRIRENNDDRYISIYIKINSNKIFREKIGFRHCIQKTMRLEISSSYESYCNEIKKQHDNMFELVNNYIDNEHMTYKNALEKAREEYYKDKKVLNNYYSLLSLNIITNRRKKNRTNNVNIFKYRFIENAEKYCELLNCKDWFDKKTYIISKFDNSFPHFLMSIQSKNYCDDKIEVYDIGVSKYHNFIANGLIVHNCIDFSAKKNN